MTLKISTASFVILFLWVSLHLSVTASELAFELLPGSKPFSQAENQTLAKTFLGKTNTYPIASKHIHTSGRPVYVNRLILEDSPYLLQHAHNPVNWFAWGEDAFALAKQQGKPVFLSVGYSTCHWCYVMEKESFDNKDIARYLNENFISIKVDREQRPDIDEIYMVAVQMITGQGGWPMSTFLTDQGKPFYGGTYFPPEEFLSLLQRMTTLWQQNEEKLRQSANQLSLQINRYLAHLGEEKAINATLIEQAIDNILASYDKDFGGFGPAPKFHNENKLLLLLSKLWRDPNAEVSDAVYNTLDSVINGGIYDQVGGGVHRYSTDPEWKIPHFEKMAYNQAYMISLFSSAYVLTEQKNYRQASIEIVDYVLRDLTNQYGGFYSATGATSEGKEGAFFTWTIEQLKAALTPADYLIAKSYWNISEAIDVNEPQVLSMLFSPNTKGIEADKHHQSYDQKIIEIKQTLYQHRENREHPLLDEKMITAWNGLLISSLVDCDKYIKYEVCLVAAKKAADYIWSVNYSKQNNTLFRIHLDGKSSVNALLEDYAYFAQANLALYDIEADSKWLDRAILLVDTMLEMFGDPQGGFFTSSNNSNGPVIVKSKSILDGAIASGNSVALDVLQKLFRHTGDFRYKQWFEKSLVSFSGKVSQGPENYSYMLLSVLDNLQGASGSRQTLAKGAIRAELSATSQTTEYLRWRLIFNIKKGWHINAHSISNQDLIPTKVTLADQNNAKSQTLLSLDYPAGKAKYVTFLDGPLELYEGNVVISGKIKKEAFTSTLNQKSTKSLPLLSLSINIQACSDRVCLRPEQTVITLPVSIQK